MGAHAPASPLLHLPQLHQEQQTAGSSQHQQDLLKPSAIVSGTMKAPSVKLMSILVTLVLAKMVPPVILTLQVQAKCAHVPQDLLEHSVKEQKDVPQVGV